MCAGGTLYGTLELSRLVGEAGGGSAWSGGGSGGCKIGTPALRRRDGGKLWRVTVPSGSATADYRM